MRIRQMSRHTFKHIDMILLGTVSLGTFVYFAANQFKKLSPTNNTSTFKPEKTAPKIERNFVKVMKQQGRRVVFFYGSQTGTAEDFAARLAKECTQKYGVSAMTADIEQYDLSYLDTADPDILVFFIMATYGEGEPTDNAVEFWDFLTEESPLFSESQEADALQKLRYAAFGLGNKTYEHYNEVIRRVDSCLSSLGAQRIGEVGEGDDDNSLEEDFLAWQETMWPAFCQALGVDESGANKGPRQPIYNVKELEPDNNRDVYLGEIGEWIKENESTVYDAKRPYYATLTSKELFEDSDRHCLHLEIDISGTNLSYQTGDHVAIWPTNNEEQVDLLARVLGLKDKLDTVVSVEALDPAAPKKHPFPVPTTYRAALRHYLDLGSVASRQSLMSFVEFAPTETSQQMLKALATDKTAYRARVGDVNLSLGEVLTMVMESDASEGAFGSIPFDLIIESISRLQPRYYSISSSSRENPQSIAVTLVSLEYQPDTTPRTVYGVNTNYILRMHEKMHQMPASGPRYALEGPRERLWDGKTARVPVHVRRSTFKLPQDPSIPIIMVGPGTGVAPFRGFVRERVLQKKNGPVGPTVLFFGCRNSKEDFLYKDEWPGLFDTLGDDSRLITAFSRETDRKVYVQHRLMEHAVEMWGLLEKGAYIYVCGDAKNMARDVNQTFIRFAQQLGGMSEPKAQDYIKKLRNTSRYQEDVWS